jgi:hypothetical protein
LQSKNFERVRVVLKTYHVGDTEIRVHHRIDNDRVVQAWKYTNGVLSDTVLSIDHGKKAKVVKWLFEAQFFGA